MATKNLEQKNTKKGSMIQLFWNMTRKI